MTYTPPTDPSQVKRILGIKASVFIPVASLILIAGTVVLIRQSFKKSEPSHEEVPAQAVSVTSKDLATLKEAALLAPKSAKAQRAYGKALAKAGRHKEAIDWFGKAKRAGGDRAGVSWDLGRSYRALGRYDDAIASYKEVIREEPQNAQAYAEAAEVLEAKGDEEQAGVFIGMARSLQQTGVTRGGAGTAAAGEAPGSAPAGAPGGAAPEGGTPGTGPGGAQGSEPGDETPGAESGEGGEALVDVGQTGQQAADGMIPSGQALSNPGDSLLFSGDSVEVNIGLGTLYNSTGQYGNASQLFQKVLGIDPSNAQAYYGLGIAQLGLGNRAAAITAYNALVTLDPALAGNLLVEINK